MDGVVEQTGFLASPVTRRCAEEITLGNDLRAAALMNLGTVEAWSLALTDAERHLREGAALAREIGCPYLEVGCLAQLGFASAAGSLATARARSRAAASLRRRHIGVRPYWPGARLMLAVSGGASSPLLATSLYDDPAAGLCGDAPAGLDEHPEHGL